MPTCVIDYIHNTVSQRKQRAFNFLRVSDERFSRSLLAKNRYTVSVNFNRIVSTLDIPLKKRYMQWADPERRLSKPSPTWGEGGEEGIKSRVNSTKKKWQN